MLKEMEFTQRIAIMQPQQTAFSKWLHAIRAAYSRRIVIDAATPKYMIVQQLVNRYFYTPAPCLMLIPENPPYFSAQELLPSERMTKPLKLHKSKYDYGWAVYRRRRNGKVVKVVWLLKLSDTEAHIALYVSRSCYSQTNTD